MVRYWPGQIRTRATRQTTSRRGLFKFHYCKLPRVHALTHQLLSCTAYRTHDAAAPPWRRFVWTDLESKMPVIDMSAATLVSAQACKCSTGTCTWRAACRSARETRMSQYAALHANTHPARLGGELTDRTRMPNSNRAGHRPRRRSVAKSKRRRPTRWLKAPRPRVLSPSSKRKSAM